MSANSKNEEQFMKTLTDIIEANLSNENFGVSELAHEIGMSRSNLYRKVILKTGLTISQLIREHRLKRAMELLQTGSLNVSEIAFEVGFGSVTYFTKCFHDYYGYPPGEAGNGKLSEKIFGPVIPEENLGQNKKQYLVRLLTAAFILLAAAAILFLVSKPSSPIEKSIAVLPFVDESPKDGNSYIINGLREEILDKLEKIKDLQVKSRTETEKYKESKLTIHEIGKKLNVNYILEGSGQKIDDKIRIRIQLIEVQSGNHLWSKPFEEEVDSANIFDIQEDVALSVAKELGAVILPEEKRQITRKPTKNPAALYYFRQGLALLKLAGLRPEWAREKDVMEAKKMFERALELDSTYVDANVYLAHTYIDWLIHPPISDSTKQQYLDTCFALAKRALRYDPQNGWAFYLKSQYFQRTGKLKEAAEELEKSQKLIPPHNDKVWVKHYEYSIKSDYYNMLLNFYQYQDRGQNDSIMTTYGMIIKMCECFSNLGFPETTKLYARRLLTEYNDTLAFKWKMFEAELYSGNFGQATNYALYPSSFMLISAFKRDYSKAYEYLLKYETESKKAGNSFGPDPVLGFIYLKNGRLEKANYHFDGAIKKLQDEIDRNLENAQKLYSQLTLACIYAVKGEKEKAIKYLKIFKTREIFSTGDVTSLKNWPMFDNIRNEPEFADVLKYVENKYQRIHKRAEKLLKERGDLR